MSVGIILQARMGSTRLPGKVLKQVGAYQVLELQIRRILTANSPDQFVVAIPQGSSEDLIAELASSLGVKVFRGPEDDVLARFALAAEANGIDTIVRLTGDCPLVDPFTIDTLVGIYEEGGFDFVSNSEPLPTPWPDGSDVSVFSLSALLRADDLAATPGDREHVTFPFWKYPKHFNSFAPGLDRDLADYRYTVDYPEDLEVLEEIVRNLSLSSIDSVIAASMEDVIRVIDENPQIASLNRGYSRGMGWNASENSI